MASKTVLSDTASAVVEELRKQLNEAEKNSVLWSKAADGADATATSETLMGSVPVDGEIIAVRITPAAALTAGASNNATITVAKRDTAGASTTVATFVTTAGGTGNWTAWVPLKAASLANTVFTAGESFTVAITKGGDGVTVPASVIAVEYRAGKEVKLKK